MEMPFCSGAGYFSSEMLGYKKGEDSPLRRVSEYEIECYAGPASFGMLNGERIQYPKNGVMIFRPGDERCSHLPFSCWFLHLSVSDPLLRRFLEQSPRKREAGGEDFLPLFRQVASLYPVSEQEELAFLSLFFTLLDRLQNEKNAPPRPAEQSGETDAVAIAKGFMTEHFGKKLLLSDIARAVHLSPNYFHSLFTARCGITPAEYLLQIRLSKAKLRLVSTMDPISRIAGDCGFSSYNYFGTLFKKRFGMTPLTYRKQNTAYRL